MNRYASFARLKHRFDHASAPPAGEGLFSLGCNALDARLGGGLARGALHELCAAQEGDRTTTSGFALMLALRAAGEGRSILWVREEKGERAHGALYAPGLAELGADADRIILIHAPDTLAALRAAAEILRVRGPGAVIIEPFGAAKALDLTASRKLVLAAEKGGAGAFILRDPSSRLASAAATRWQVASAPSAPLAGGAPGHPTLALSLLRHRGGVAPFDLKLEWNRDEQAFIPGISESAVPKSADGATLPRAGLSGFERGQMAA